MVAIPIMIAVPIVVIASVAIMVVAVSSATAELAVDIDDACTAVIKIVERGPDPAAVASLASGAEKVAVDIDRSTGLNVGSLGLPRSPAALEMAIVVDNLADAVVDILQGRTYPAAIHGLAPGEDPVAKANDLAARLAIRSAGQIVALPPFVAPVAAEIAVDVGYVAHAFAGFGENGRTPATVRILAVGVECSLTHLNIRTCLPIAAFGRPLQAVGSTTAKGDGSEGESHPDQVAHSSKSSSGVQVQAFLFFVGALESYRARSGIAGMFANTARFGKTLHSRSKRSRSGCPQISISG
jgi:hypothetical protein